MAYVEDAPMEPAAHAAGASLLPMEDGDAGEFDCELPWVEKYRPVDVRLCLRSLVPLNDARSLRHRAVI